MVLFYGNNNTTAAVAAAKLLSLDRVTLACMEVMMEMTIMVTGDQEISTYTPL